jgi:hypothetical protein
MATTGTTDGHGLRRGGVLAGAAALLAGALAKAAERVARAADGEPLLLGQTNAAVNTTVLNRASPTFPPAFANALHVTNNSGVSVRGAGIGAGILGVLGESQFGTGVRGVGFEAGVQGESGGTGVAGRGEALGVDGSGPVGVQGRSTGFGAATGVLGISFRGGAGVRGEHTGLYQDISGPGVLGRSSGGAGVVGSGAPGVLGSALDGTGTGVRGETTDGVALDGAAFGAGHGVVGFSRDHIGVTGQGGSFGVYATSPGLAGRFDGAVEVNGPLVVRGDLHVVGPLAAAVAAPDGSRRRVHPLASPEAWLEDFGEAQLTGGASQVRLDPEFAALAREDAYHVFLTAYGDTPGLYVSGRGPGGFEVRERPGGPGGTAFAYRVVARRRDAAGPRLERATPPPPRPVRVPPPPAQVQRSEVPPLPEVPERPPLPELPEVPEVPPRPDVPPGQRRGR